MVAPAFCAFCFFHSPAPVIGSLISTAVGPVCDGGEICANKRENDIGVTISRVIQVINGFFWAGFLPLGLLGGLLCAGLTGAVHITLTRIRHYFEKECDEKAAKAIRLIEEIIFIAAKIIGILLSTLAAIYLGLLLGGPVGGVIGGLAALALHVVPWVYSTRTAQKRDQELLQ